MRNRLLLSLVLATLPLAAQVTYERLLHADHEPQNWLTYSGNYAGTRYSPLTQITRANVRDLELKWVYHPRIVKPSQIKMEDTPIVVDGVLYAGNALEVSALDAVTGRTFWTVHHPLDPKAYYNAYETNKGVGVSGDTVYWATIDCHLIAIDAKTGVVVWDKVMADWQKGYQYNVPPLVVKDKVILGPATNEMGSNCWVSAYDAKTGKELWRFWTAPQSADDPAAKTWTGDSWKHAGNPIWNAGSYDPDTNLTFWGIGNPNPGWNGDSRLPADNLYSDSVVALDADTGKLKWHFQFTPGDEYDWDSTQVPVLADIEWKGQPRKVMMWAQPQRPLLRAGPHHRPVPDGQALRQAELGSGPRRNGPAHQSARPLAQAHGPRVCRARNAGRHQLVSAVLQPAHAVILYVGVGELFGPFAKVRSRSVEAGNALFGQHAAAGHAASARRGFGPPGRRIPRRIGGLRRHLRAGPEDR